MISNTATWPRSPWTFLSGIMILANLTTTSVSEDLRVVGCPIQGWLYGWMQVLCSGISASTLNVPSSPSCRRLSARHYGKGGALETLVRVSEEQRQED